MFVGRMNDYFIFYEMYQKIGLVRDKLLMVEIRL